MREKKKQPYGTGLDAAFCVKCSPQQLAMLEDAAAQRNVTMAQVVRDVLFGTERKKGALS